jgi:uncharacterized protein
MASSRRQFLIRSAAYAAGFTALAQWARTAVFKKDAQPDNFGRYGPLTSDPRELLDLPRDFSYTIISRSGQPMDDGYLVPGNPDGMATFAGPDGATILLRNHELSPDESPGPFGDANVRLKPSDQPLLYDFGGGQTPHLGGTTTVVYDTKRRNVVRQFLSLAGTSRNCSGGPTPWQSWISCEETVIKAGAEGDFRNDKDHGYNFEVPAHHLPALTKPVPLTDMGRFNHEAVAVDPQTSIVYQTEDRDDGLLYRFVPRSPGQLVAGGQLQALRLNDAPSIDMRNWGSTSNIAVGRKMHVEWFNLEDVTSPADDLRYRGFAQGAARFARGEGMWYAGGQVYFASTSGGREQKGQIWRYVPSPSPDKNRPAEGGTLELFVEPNDSRLLESADNLTAAPWGDLIVCEDREGDVVRLVGITPHGQPYTFANSHAQSEFSGVTFSPDGSTLFVNIQHKGLTLAITGPW